MKLSCEVVFAKICNELKCIKSVYSPEHFPEVLGEGKLRSFSRQEVHIAASSLLCQGDSQKKSTLSWKSVRTSRAAFSGFGAMQLSSDTIVVLPTKIANAMKNWVCQCSLP